MSIDKRFDDALNFRDLGGLKCEDGRSVRHGFFYRGAGLAYFNEDELKEFEKLHVKTIMDLRSKAESETLPDPEISGTEYIQHSGMYVKGAENIDWSPAGMRKIGKEAADQLDQISAYYHNIAFGNKAFQIMMGQIKQGKLPIYFHCATGKDRTGVGAMIILLALGVKKEEIRKDYLLSNVFRKKIVDEKLAKEGRKIIEHPELADLITLMDGVLNRTFDTVMDCILERYASYESYLQEEFDLDEKELKRLRDLYLE